jgi:hypothetical protein
MTIKGWGDLQRSATRQGWKLEIRGSVFLHGFDIPHGSELELGCLYHSLSLWQEEGGAVGGMASKGHGRLLTGVVGGDSAEIERLASLYVAHVDTHAESCRVWLDQAFRTRPAKADKSPKKKAVADDAG